MKYFYRDFGTSKPRWTQGKFGGWTPPTGLLNIKYAIFVRRSDTLLVPEYCLAHETKQALQQSTFN